MKPGFEPRPVLRSVRSRLVGVFRKLVESFGSYHTLIRTRTFAVSVYLSIALILFTFVALNLKTVQVVDGENSQYIYTFRTQPAQILKQIGITLTSDDKTDFTGFTNNFATLVLYEAFPVSVTADNSTTTILLAQGTVSDAIAKAGVAVGNDDIVSTPLDTVLTASTSIVVQRVTYQTVVRNEPIPYQTVSKTTTLLKKNAKSVVTQGKDGTTKITARQKYIDGVLSGEEIISQVVVSQPVTCQVLVGSASNTPISTLTPPSWLTLNDSGVPTSYVRVIHGKATAYSSADGTYCATGKKAQVGYVAVDPDIIPYGSKLYIMSSSGSFVYGYAIAEDTGGFTSNGSGVDVDLFFSSSKEAGLFGSRSVDIYVLT